MLCKKKELVQTCSNGIAFLLSLTQTRIKRFLGFGRRHRRTHTQKREEMNTSLICVPLTSGLLSQGSQRNQIHNNPTRNPRFSNFRTWLPFPVGDEPMKCDDGRLVYRKHFFRWVNKGIQFMPALYCTCDMAHKIGRDWRGSRGQKPDI